MSEVPALPRIDAFVDHYARLFPDRQAATDEAGSITYGALAVLVDTLAAEFAALGVRAGDRVVQLATPGLGFYAAFLATLRCGGIWTGLNPRHTDAELDHVVDTLAPRLVLVAAEMQQARSAWLRDAWRRLGSIAAIRFVVAGADRMRLAASSVFGDRRGAPSSGELDHDAALIVFTSGTTGTPKGAVIGHRALVATSRIQARQWDVGELRVLNNLPVNHIGCVGDITCWALVAGGTIAFAASFEAAAIPARIERDRLTVWAQVPTMFVRTMAQEGFDRRRLRSLKLIVWGGAAAPRELVTELLALGCRVATSYGQTETVGSVAFTPADATPDLLATTVGRAVPPYRIRVHAPEAGTPGEIELWNPHRMLFYWNDPDSTRAIDAGDGWMRTGDVGFVLPDDSLVLAGRSGDVFKSGGYNLYPAEIERALGAQEAIAQVAVVGIPDPLYGTVAIGFCVLHRGCAADEGAVLGAARARLANYKVPKRIFFLDVLPVLPIGKIDKVELRAEAIRRCAASSGEAAPVRGR